MVMIKQNERKIDFVDSAYKRLLPCVHLIYAVLLPTADYCTVFLRLLIVNSDQ